MVVKDGGWKLKGKLHTFLEKTQFVSNMSSLVAVEGKKILLFIFALCCCYYYYNCCCSSLSTDTFSAKVVLKSSIPNGHFLHITDIHPDPYYLTESNVSTSCHRLTTQGKPRKKKGDAGKWGTPATRCDTPWRFVDFTLEWLNENWGNKLDFIVFTGDGVRHNSDRNLPRTAYEVLRSNQDVARALRAAFPPHIPIIPTLGNNDVFPHNILYPGPGNQVLAQFVEIWHSFIPESQTHSFQNYGFFAIDVNPALSVLSLNTLYFSESNAAVFGCSRPEDPGTVQLNWLRVRLIDARRRKTAMVYIIGHIAPLENMWYEDCTNEYTKLVIEFADVVKSQLFGHSNVDHFFFLTKSDSNGKEKQRGITLPSSQPATLGWDTDYLDRLLQDYEAVVNSTNSKSTNYSVAHVVPSIMPVYYPGFRIYNFQAPNYQPIGYTQYFCNLTKWNAPGKSKHPEWEVEYDTKEDYGMLDLSPWSWVQLAQRILEDSIFRQIFFKHFYVSVGEDVPHLASGNG